MVKRLGRLRALTAARLKTPGLYPDGGGLYLQIVGAGGRSWVYRFMLRGRTRDMGLGSLADVPLAEARAQAELCRRQRAAGIDPIEARKAEQERLALEAANAVTFQACAEAYIEAHAPGWRNAKHAAQWRNTLATYAAPIFGAMPVQAVKLPQIMKALEPVWADRPETASRVRGRIEAVLDWATTRGYRTGENPARWRGHLENLVPKRSKVRRVKHHPALPYSEVGAFMEALRAEEGTAARALEFLILTAARSGEVRGARFDEVRDKVWHVPGERMKAGQPHRVPLSEAAFAVVKTAKERRAGDLMFPGRKEAKPLSDMALSELMRRMKRPNGKPWTDADGRPAVPHGFRSTYRDWATECTAYPSEIVELALAHAIRDKTEAAYRRGDALEKRRLLMRDWAAFCARPMPKRGEVVALSRNRRG